MRLASKVGPVHQEEHPLCVGVPDQPVDRGNCRERLAGAGRHLDQGARLVELQRPFQVRDRGPLRGPQVSVVDRFRQSPEPPRQCRRPDIVRDPFLRNLCFVGVDRACPEHQRRITTRISRALFSTLLAIRPSPQRLRTVEPEHRSASWLRIEQVGESRLDPGAFVEHRQRCHPRVGETGQPLGVDSRLRFHTGQGYPPRLRLDDPHRPPVGDEQVIGFAGARNRHLANGNAGSGTEVHLLAVLNDPTGQAQLAVDVFAGKRFRIGHGSLSGRHFECMIPASTSIVPKSWAASALAPLRDNGSLVETAPPAHLTPPAAFS